MHMAQVEGGEPALSPDDCLHGERIAKADPKVQEQLKLRGVTNLDLVVCDPWSGQCPLFLCIPFATRLGDIAMHAGIWSTMLHSNHLQQYHHQQKPKQVPLSLNVHCYQLPCKPELPLLSCSVATETIGHLLCTGQLLSLQLSGLTAWSHM